MKDSVSVSHTHRVEGGGGGGGLQRLLPGLRLSTPAVARRSLPPFLTFLTQ